MPISVLEALLPTVAKDGLTALNALHAMGIIYRDMHVSASPLSIRLWGSLSVFRRSFS